MSRITEQIFQDGDTVWGDLFWSIVSTLQCITYYINNKDVAKLAQNVRLHDYVFGTLPLLYIKNNKCVYSKSVIFLACL